jgi:Ca2+-binding RTX toxin-like protein
VRSVASPDPDEDPEDVDFVCGGDGDDTVGGGEGQENVVAGGGRDLLVGGFDLVSGTPDPGADLLRGDKGKDFLYGQDGNDKVKGGKGKYRLTGGPGNDKLRARDGERDLVKCGGGQDSAWVDPDDTVKRSCEKVRGGGG